MGHCDKDFEFHSKWKKKSLEDRIKEWHSMIFKIFIYLTALGLSWGL